MSNGLGEVVEAAKKAEIAEKLSDKPLCDHCLGRLFGKVSTGLDNPSRGGAIRESLGLEKGKKCWLCGGLFDEIEKFSDMIEEELENIEYESFSAISGFSMLVRTNPQPLRKRLDPRRETEDYLRGICHNIKRLCYLRYLADIVPIPSEPGA